MAESRNIEGSMENAIGEVLRRIYAEGRRGDLLAVTIYHPALDDPLYIGYSREEKLTADKIIKCIWRIQQSKRKLNYDEALTFKFSRIRTPVGGRPRQW